MADFSYAEMPVIEAFFEMGGGYVLDFSDTSFGQFVGRVTGINIDDAKYCQTGASKGKRLRSFIALESETILGKLFAEAHKYKKTKYKIIGKDYDQEVAEEFEKIVNRLQQSGVVTDVDALQANNDDKDFSRLAAVIQESIRKNEPEIALDRLHTFVVKYVRELCNVHQIEYTKAESLNAIFGKYVKHLVNQKMLESEMSEKILKYSIQLIDAFNDIRNNKSLAHDNAILNYQESVLIFNNVSATIRFVQHIEEKRKETTGPVAADGWGDFKV